MTNRQLYDILIIRKTKRKEKQGGKGNEDESEIDKWRRELRKDSGEIDISGDRARMIAFFYVLMRDYITPGKV